MSKYRRGIAALNGSKNDPGCAERALRRQAARTNSTTERHDLGSTALNICLHFHSFAFSATEYCAEWAELLCDRAPKRLRDIEKVCVVVSLTKPSTQ